MGWGGAPLVLIRRLLKTSSFTTPYLESRELHHEPPEESPGRSLCFPSSIPEIGRHLRVNDTTIIEKPAVASLQLDPFTLASPNVRELIEVVHTPAALLAAESSRYNSLIYSRNSSAKLIFVFIRMFRYIPSLSLSLSVTNPFTRNIRSFENRYVSMRKFLLQILRNPSTVTDKYRFAQGDTIIIFYLNIR